MSISREVLAKYIIPGCTFVETGTRWGYTTLRAIELGAYEAYTCETDGLYIGLAKAFLADALRERAARVTVKRMDSTVFLEQLCLNNGRPVVAYLDAHSETRSPVVEELGAIARWPVKPKTILIDDMRCMSGWGIPKGHLDNCLQSIGYQTRFENGIVDLDILCGFSA